MRVFVSGLRKLVGRPASFVTLGLLAGLLVLIIVATAAVSTRDASPAAQARALVLVRFPGAYDLILQFILGLGGLFAVIYGAAIAGSEWGWGTLKNAVARGESRTRYLLLMFAAIAVMVAVGLVITFVVGIAAAVVGANIAGVPTTGLTDAATLNRMPAQFVRGWFAVVEEASSQLVDGTNARRVRSRSVALVAHAGEAPVQLEAHDARPRGGGLGDGDGLAHGGSEVSA